MTGLDLKIFDMHIHAQNTAQSPHSLIEKMSLAGIYGGCVFSARPVEASKTLGTGFKERIEEAFNWVKGYPGRLFPVMWIHPDEKNIKKNIRIAAGMGICAFKIICTDFYPFEKKCIKVLEEIARLGRPAIFHSGILWDGGESSKYNRPANFEKLIEVDNLKFSLAHCSWPWIDECIAVYGKFLNGIAGGRTAEMFIDITPGTPQIYREELLTKLFTVGYDVPNNIMFGTDNVADSYNADWTKKWLKLDGEIYAKLGVTEKILKKIYHDNLLRFLNLKEKDFIHLSPLPDKEIIWSIDYENARV